MSIKVKSPFYVDIPVEHGRFYTDVFDSFGAPLTLNRYEDGSLVISVFDVFSGHEPLNFDPTVYNFKVRKNHVIVKGYGNYIGVADALVELGLACEINKI